MSILSPQQLQDINSTTTALVEESKATNSAASYGIDPVTNLPNSKEDDIIANFIKPNPKNYTLEARTVGGSLGFIVGLGYAFKVKSGFWKGWGYTILGSIALGGLGYGIGMAIKKKDNGL